VLIARHRDPLHTESVASALTGKGFGSALGNPWLVAAIAVVFLSLSASLFGAFEIALPASGAVFDDEPDRESGELPMSRAGTSPSSWPRSPQRPRRARLNYMQPLKAHVRNGRLVLDEPTDLPEGEVVYLQPVDAVLDEEFDEEERAQLRQALDESIEQMKAGQTIDVADAMAELRAHR
jgi:hypothetical protein